VNCLPLHRKDNSGVCNLVTVVIQFSTSKVYNLEVDDVQLSNNIHLNTGMNCVAITSKLCLRVAEEKNHNEVCRQHRGEWCAFDNDNFLVGRIVLLDVSVP
jgi:hypothetical protein